MTVKKGDLHRTRVHQYCMKEDLAPLQKLQRALTPLKDGDAGEKETFGSMLNRETSVRTGMKRLAELHPDEYYRNGGRIMPMLRLRIGRPVKPKYSLDQFSLVGHELPLSLLKPILLHGSSEVGKTAMALAHFEYPHLISNMDDLKHIGLDCDGLVFDDMNFSHLTAEECIALLDMEYERTIKCRYYNAEIPAGLPRVFTSNAPMIFPPGRTAAQQAAIDRRYTIIGPITADLRVLPVAVQG